MLYDHLDMGQHWLRCHRATKPMLTNHQWCSVTFTWKQLHNKCFRYQSLKWVWKLVKIIANNLTGGEWVDMINDTEVVVVTLFPTKYMKTHRCITILQLPIPKMFTCTVSVAARKSWGLSSWVLKLFYEHSLYCMCHPLCFGCFLLWWCCW